jgi:hypothetical protein
MTSLNYSAILHGLKLAKRKPPKNKLTGTLIMGKFTTNNIELRILRQRKEAAASAKNRADKKAAALKKAKAASSNPNRTSARSAVKKKQ